DRVVAAAPTAPQRRQRGSGLRVRAGCGDRVDAGHPVRLPAVPGRVPGLATGAGRGPSARSRIEPTNGLAAGRDPAYTGRMSFRDRQDAGAVLADALDEYVGQPDVLVLGLVRGGVPVAAEVARRLDAPLDALVVRKLGVPWAPEVAFGAMGSG